MMDNRDEAVVLAIYNTLPRTEAISNYFHDYTKRRKLAEDIYDIVIEAGMADSSLVKGWQRLHDRLYETCQALRAKNEDLRAEVELLRERDHLFIDSLVQARDFFEHRDRMNAEVHCSEVRWSPLTVQLQEAARLAELGEEPK